MMSHGMNRRLFAAALELVLILGRHGVRSPLQTTEQLAPYAAQPWPVWTVPPGDLTPNGVKGQRRLGYYFRERYIAAGLLSGHASTDATAITLRADKDDRTVESAQLLGEALAPGQPLRLLRHAPDKDDALFSGTKLDLGHIDRQSLVAAVQGRIGNDLAALEQAHRPEFSLLQRILFPGGRVPPGKTALLSLPAAVEPGLDYDAIHIRGPFIWGMRIVDDLQLEYCDGWKASRLGWGRLDGATLTQLMVLHELYFNLTQKTLACAQANASDLARHLEETLMQAASGRTVPGAIGPAGQKIVIVLGHDTNLINLAGLLNIDWMLPGGQRDPLLPGGALVFELRRDDAGRQWLRLQYIAATLEQQHRGERLTLRHPPGIAPIFIPGCSGSGPTYDAPLEAVERKLDQVIDPRCVVPESS